MAEQVFPTKGNLIKAKRSLQQAKQGFELMDRKRNVLIREMVALTDKSKLVRGNIEQTYEKAYAALQKANITLGSVSTLTQFVPEETDLKISFRSVMGVELPTVELLNDILRSVSSGTNCVSVDTEPSVMLAFCRAA